jgi:hypothetical protein
MTGLCAALNPHRLVRVEMESSIVSFDGSSSHLFVMRNVLMVQGSADQVVFWHA